MPACAPSKSRRTISLPARVVDALRARRQRQLAERLALGPDDARYDLVFATATGTPLGHRNVTRAYKLALGRADFPASTRFHELRHAAATAMRIAGIDIKTVSERLGHSTIAITADLYTHAVASMESDAADRLQRAIRG